MYMYKTCFVTYYLLPICFDPFAIIIRVALHGYWDYNKLPYYISGTTPHYSGWPQILLKLTFCDHMENLSQIHGFLSPRCRVISGSGWRNGSTMEGSCEYIEYAVTDSRQGVVLQLGALARCKQLLAGKTGLVWKRIHAPRSWTDRLLWRNDRGVDGRIRLRWIFRK